MTPSTQERREEGRTYDLVRHEAEGGKMRRSDDNEARASVSGWFLGIMDPIQRVISQDPHAYVLAGVVAASTLVTQYAFLACSLLLALASWSDYVMGRRLAYLEKKENEHLASIGRVLKVTAFIQLWILWGLEALVNVVNPWGVTTDGYVAVFAALVLIADEMDSLDGHRVTRGKRPLFGWRSYRDRIMSKISGSDSKKGR
jgi:hypothetical protein